MQEILTPAPTFRRNGPTFYNMRIARRNLPTADSGAGGAPPPVWDGTGAETSPQKLPCVWYVAAVEADRCLTVFEV